MKRIGYVLLISSASMVIYTFAMAQLEARNTAAAAKHLLRVISGKNVRGYFGSDIAGPAAWSGEKPLFAVAETGEANGPVRRGKVHFYDGLLADAPIMSIESPSEGSVFGKTLSTGDFNGDGIPDLAVGAPGSRESAGKAYIYFGGSGFGGSPSATLTANENGDDFGSALSMKDDINGDGLADLVVGAPQSAKAGATAGRAYVWYGRKEGSVNSEPSATIPLGTTNDLFGTSITSGDINGDGKADLIIGAPHYNVGADMKGGVFIFAGGEKFNPKSATKILTGEGSSFQDQFGKAVCFVGDVNLDGVGDFLVGAPQVTNGGKQVGKVYLYNGGETLPSVSLTTYWGSVEAGQFGSMIYSLGDMNADGKGDWAVQAPSSGQSKGILHFYYGGWENDFYQFAGEMLADQLGNAAVSLGDWDGNGTKEVIVGARWNDTEGENAGRVYFLSFQ